MQSNMSVVKSSKVSQSVVVVGVVKKSISKKNLKKNNIKQKNNLSIICCGLLRGDMMTTMFRGTTMHHGNM